MTYNRDRNNRSSGGFRPRFNDRSSSRGPVEMHKAICDKCGRECEVPFRPTQGKPVFCSNCFESQRGTEPRRFEERRPDSSKDQFEALNQKLDKILQLLEAK